MKKLLVAAGSVAALFAAVVALTGFAGGCGHHGRHPRDPAQLAALVTGRVDDVLDDLDATPDQRTRIHAIKDRLLAAGQQAREGHREAHDALREAWRSERPDAARLHALVDARAEALRALAHQAVDAGVEVHEVLTPAQREKVTKKIERWHR